MTKLTRYFLVVLVALVAISLLWTIGLAMNDTQRSQAFSDGGYPAPSVMANQMTNAAGQFFLVCVVAGGTMVYLLRKNGSIHPSLRWGLCGLLALILYLQQWVANDHFMDYRRPSEIYASNAVIKILREAPGRPRVALLSRAVRMQEPPFYNYWLSLLFPYWDIDSIDIPAASRPPADYVTFFGTMDRHPLRKWEICSVRYVLAPSEIGLQFFKSQNSSDFFRPAIEFEMPQGTKNALFEYSRALPRAVVLHRWEVIADDTVLLNRLVEPQFDPHTTLLLNQPPPVPPDPAAPSSSPATIVDFKPTHIVIQTSVKSPGVLMLNDRIFPQWEATVDGQPVKILRANFIMRAVPLAPGEHRVEFHYTVPASSWWLTWGEWIAIGLGLIATGIGILRRKLA